MGSGRTATFLHAIPAAIYTFGITAEGVDAFASVSDLTVNGACTLGIRPNNGLICNEAFPEFIDTTFLGAGIDVLVFSMGSQPILRNCSIENGDRYAVRVVLYGPGTEIDLSGNTCNLDMATALNLK